MKKILYITYRLPFPPDRGDRIRMYQMAKMLSERNCLHLLAIVDKEVSKEHLQALGKIFKEIQIFVVPQWKSYLNSFFALFSSYPLQQGYFHDSGASEWVLKNRQKYDCIFCSTVRVARYAKRFEGKKFIDFIDALSLNFSSISKFHSNPFFRALCELEAPRLRKCEIEVCKTFDKVFIISEAEGRKIASQKISSKKIISVPPAINVPAKISKLAASNKILFFGNFDYFPNVDAATFFAKEVFPKISKKFPSAEFVVAGYFSSKLAKLIPKNARIKILGYVQDIDSLILESALVVAPMRCGSGINQKVLKSLSLGKVIVLSSLSNAEMGAVSGKEVEIADSPQELAEKCIGLLEDSKRRGRLGKAALIFIRKNFSYYAARKKLFAAMQNL